MAAPFEILAAPFTVYVAAVGVAYPAINAAPSGSWTKLGTSGTKNYDEEGVTVTHEQEIATWTPAGSTAPQKAWRTSEGLVIAFTLVDVSPAQYAKAMNDATLNTVAGPPGDKNFSLLQGMTVARFTLLVRGISSLDDTLNAQYEVPIVFENGNQAPVYKKGDPAGLALEFVALEDATTGFGKLRIQSS
jgi:hypothetical protein